MGTILFIARLRPIPDWKPGHQQGKPVNVVFTMPIVFKLTDPKYRIN